MNQYAVGVCALRDTGGGRVEGQIKTIVFPAQSEAEAFGLGIRAAMLHWPAKDGWMGHACSTAVVPREQ